MAKHFLMVTEGPRDGYFACEVVQNDGDDPEEVIEPEEDHPLLPDCVAELLDRWIVLFWMTTIFEPSLTR